MVSLRDQVLGHSGAGIAFVNRLETSLSPSGLIPEARSTNFKSNPRINVEMITNVFSHENKHFACQMYYQLTTTQTSIM